MTYQSIYTCVAIALLSNGCGGGSTTPPPPVATTLLTPDCNGAKCSASSSVSYSGSGVGVWKYINPTAADVTLNIDIAGFASDTQVTLVFTNGKEVDNASTPSAGTQASYDVVKSSRTLDHRSTAPSARHDAHEALEAHEAHTHLIGLRDNQAAVDRLKTAAKDAPSAADLLKHSSKTVAYKTPAINARRSWNDYFGGTTGVPYATTNQYVCALPSGRNLVFWQDGSLSQTYLNTLTAAACGASGGFARIIAVLGEPWGANNYSYLIKDTPNSLLDINIVLINAASSDWGGYFGARNNYLSTSTYPSNEALAFFINTKFLLQGTNINATVSTLFHEATHMINYYQNSVVRGKTHESWLEETSAMMSEDIISTPVTGYNRIAISRIPGYMRSGGDVSLNKWTLLDLNHYYMGGALGAYLNRQYGLNIYKQLITSCTSAAMKTNSYACLDSLIVNNGGIGLADSVSKMGATVFGAIPAAAAPQGYGFVAKTDGAYALEAIDVAAAAVAPAVLSGFKSMSHSYLNDTVAVGYKRYTRSQVRVPGNTQLNVVIKN
jgi:hypothetical protein